MPALTGSPGRGLRQLIFPGLVGCIIFLADQLSKEWILRCIPAGTYIDPAPIPVIRGFFYIVHIYNTGAAWGIMEGLAPVLTLLAFLVLGAIVVFRRHLGLEVPLLRWALGSVCGGIVGNLVDRLRHGHVVDFLDFHLPGYRWPAFNIADSAITVGVFIYLFCSFWGCRAGKNSNTQPS